MNAPNEASTKKLLLSATSEAVRPESVEDIGRDICHVTVVSRAREKLLKR